MSEDDFAKRVHESQVQGNGIRGRSPVKWINRVKEYWSERELAGKGLNVWSGSAGTGNCGDPSAIWKILRGQGTGDIDRQIDEKAVCG